EGAGRAQGKVVPVLATRIGMLSARAQLLEQLAFERVDHRHVIRLVGGVDQVPDDFETVRTLEFSRSPGPEEFSIRVEYQHRGILALENIEAVLGIRREPADQAKGLAFGQLRKVLDEL